MSSIYDIATWIYSPLGGFRTGEQWMVKPFTGAGRIGITRATNSTRVNEAGLLETVGANLPVVDYENGQLKGGAFFGSATNLLTYSEDFTNAAWIKSGLTVSTNTTTAPDGNTTADKIVESVASGTKLIYQQQNVTVGVTATASFFLKAAERTVALVQFADGSGPTKRYGVLVNLSTGEVIETRTNNSPVGTSNKVTALSDGYYRVEVTMTQSGGTLMYAQVALSNSATPNYDSLNFPTYTGDGTSGIYIWGAQLETGSFASPYIPTTNTTATRNADSFVASNASSIIGQTQGTVFVEVNMATASTGSDRSVIYLTDGSFANYVRFIYVAGNLRADVFENSVAKYTFISNVNLSSVKGNLKLAFRYSSEDCKVFQNGVELTGTVSVNLPFTGFSSTLKRITFGSNPFGDAVFLNDHIKLAWGTDEVLTDAQCIALTTL